MIVLKYVKTGSARFISHIDILKHVTRIIRRAEIPVRFSQGFNPHALVFFSTPAVLGVGSLCEYVAIDTDMAAAEVFDRYNSSVPDGLKALNFFETLKNPNLQGKTVAADYVFPTPYFDLKIEKDFTVTYSKKGESVTEPAADRILGVFDADGKLGLRLAAGNTNLRADRVANELSRRYGLEIPVPQIVKTDQYVGGDGGTVDCDAYLSNTSL